MTTKRHLTVTYTRVLPKPVTAINWRRASGYPPDAAGSGLLPKMGEVSTRTVHVLYVSYLILHVHVHVHGNWYRSRQFIASTHFRATTAELTRHT